MSEPERPERINPRGAGSKPSQNRISPPRTITSPERKCEPSMRGVPPGASAPKAVHPAPAAAPAKPSSSKVSAPKPQKPATPAANGTTSPDRDALDALGVIRGKHGQHSKLVKSATNMGTNDQHFTGVIPPSSNVASVCRGIRQHSNVVNFFVATRGTNGQYSGVNSPIDNAKPSGQRPHVLNSAVGVNGGKQHSQLVQSHVANVIASVPKAFGKLSVKPFPTIVEVLGTVTDKLDVVPRVEAYITACIGQSSKKCKKARVNFYRDVIDEVTKTLRRIDERIPAGGLGVIQPDALEALCDPKNVGLIVMGQCVKHGKDGVVHYMHKPDCLTTCAVHELLKFYLDKYARPNGAPNVVPLYCDRSPICNVALGLKIVYGKPTETAAAQYYQLVFGLTRVTIDLVIRLGFNVKAALLLGRSYDNKNKYLKDTKLHLYSAPHPAARNNNNNKNTGMRSVAMVLYMLLRHEFSLQVQPCAFMCPYSPSPTIGLKWCPRAISLFISDEPSQLAW
eukprot:TRINITY_DN5226_c0_g1_i2.p1 TRINITY_DN5226_c0_g1~~TRINITY_DN5226_c0_g1_i2.p1  ORF type:complete len:508 (+),score=-25.31 TRINITY_DN5226_c0_g1_i2:98-1621(+)